MPNVSEAGNILSKKNKHKITKLYLYKRKLSKSLSFAQDKKSFENYSNYRQAGQSMSFRMFWIGTKHLLELKRREMFFKSRCLFSKDILDILDILYTKIKILSTELSKSKKTL